jgi:hypothetical protein
VTFLYAGYRREWVTQRRRLGTGRARRRPSLQPPWALRVVVQDDEARDTSEVRSDHAGPAGGDRNRRPTRHPALWRRACAPNGKSSTRDCPGSPDGTLSSGTAYSQAATTQSAAQGGWLLKAGIECPEFPAQGLYTLAATKGCQRRSGRFGGPLSRPSDFARDCGVFQKPLFTAAHKAQ